jgi:hypothetical protein
VTYIKVKRADLRSVFAWLIRPSWTQEFGSIAAGEIAKAETGTRLSDESEG